MAPPASAYPADHVALAGHGFGHGRGMGQYGSLGYAIDHGWDYKRILGHYYGGTHEGTLEGGDGGYLMKVRIMDRNEKDTIVTGNALTHDNQPVPGNAVLIRRVAVNQWELYSTANAECGPATWGSPFATKI